MRQLADDNFTLRQMAGLVHGDLLRLSRAGLFRAAMAMPIRTPMPLGAFLDIWADLGWRDFAVHMSAYVMIAMLMSVIGPFDTGGDPFLWRFSYWTVMLGVFGGIVMPLTARLLRNSRAFGGFSLLGGGVATLALAAAPMTIFVSWCDVLFRHVVETTERLPFVDIDLVRTRLGSAGAMHWTDGALLYVHVLAIVIVSIGLTSLYIVRGHPVSPPRDPCALTPRAGARFLSRLPTHIGGDILYLRMEDHYIRVVTTIGGTLLLMRLRDAIDELEGVPGLQVHRSWWVATGHVVRRVRDGRRSGLQMSDGVIVPVSASYRTLVDAFVAGPCSPLALPS
ncbi:MAG TPA: LytTR family DNA-binding domain-containing protein [Sphingopyxis sp.]|jgi:hypothetical protein|uniref:LytTR family DNA-binding domain-containing protein n=1 Tax=Sphingopyxis sp. TaxID=1908224 RepID=UPI002E13008A|nr:LytTR family DNA-binding domain-containing protein [Sphingopyxis sp.]